MLAMFGNEDEGKVLAGLQQENEANLQVTGVADQRPEQEEVLPVNAMNHDFILF